MKRIVLTGGGTAGHVTPNIALLSKLKEKNYDIHYIGSYHGMEKDLITQLDIPYHGISSGKLRRYFSLQNFTDPFRVIKGFGEASRLIRHLKPDVIFSKGGFVTVPVVVAGKLNRVPTIIHESDMTIGLANTISMPFSTKVCCNFPATAQILKNKAVLTGQPIREELLVGDRDKALAFTGLSSENPTLLVVGGSSGAVSVNNAVRRALPSLTKEFQIIHICGKGKIDSSLNNFDNYIQYEYIQDELPHLFALADVVVSRAGANAICEFLALNLPNLLIPLPLSASRGDQLLNAHSFEEQGFSRVLEEEFLTPERLVEVLQSLYQQRHTYIQAMQASAQKNAVDTITTLIDELATK